MLTLGTLARVHEAALRILERVGMRVLAPEILDAIGGAGPAPRPGRPAPLPGIHLLGDRVVFAPELIEDFVAQTRARSRSGDSVAEPEPNITLAPCQYATHVHDIDTDEVVPFTTDRLIEAAKLLDTLVPFGVIARSPGAPMDVAPDLQPLLKYKIQALHCRHGKGPVELTSPRATPYVMDMAEALGHPITTGDVYVVSPLTLGGESLRCVLAGKDRLKGLWVSNMSSLGATAPIGLGDALALGVAEVIGAAILVREVVGLPVEWSVRVCPFDPRAMALTLGAPEELLLQWANEEVNAWYHNRPLGPPWGSLHSQAKLPDQQAAAERMGIMLTHALFGARVFVGIGRLSLDEVFSAEQAVIDLELRDHVQRLVAGIAVECDPNACLQEVAAGVADGFLGLGSTASSYQRTYWRPRLFWRGMLAEWKAAAPAGLGSRAKAMVREQLAKHDYELDPELQREIERIWMRATHDLAG
jgi:trimethylamine:corrinoid methyltransferase-like protein